MKKKPSRVTTTKKPLARTRERVPAGSKPLGGVITELTVTEMETESERILTQWIFSDRQRVVTIAQLHGKSTGQPKQDRFLARAKVGQEVYCDFAGKTVSGALAGLASKLRMEPGTTVAKDHSV